MNKRINIVCEGQTEEAFINQVLIPYFAGKGIYLFARILGKPVHKGGRVNYARLSKDIRLLLNDKNAYCSMFVDYYGLDSNFPGKKEVETLSCIAEKSKFLENVLCKQLHNDIHEDIIRNRFLPYFQMHEFEALLFSEPEVMATHIPNVSTEHFSKIVAQFETPEHINNSVQTAPSKRIEERFSGYKKVLYGSTIASEIGLVRIRQKCNLFDQWIERLEQI